jgi:hypothetical protein
MKQHQIKFRLVVFSIFLASIVTAQDYVEYHKTINRIDEDIVNNEYALAIERLDTLYENYDFIYARHCFKALQICCVSQDSTSADKWLAKAFIQGVPIWMVRSNDLTKNVCNYSTTQSTIKQYDSLRNIYNNSISHDLRNKIDSLFEIDQKHTRKVNDGFILLRHTWYGLKWLRNNKKQFKILNEMIDIHGYPGEKLIGLHKSIEDSTQSIKFFNYIGPFLKETDTYIMLIHYYSTPGADINNKLLENVHLGNLPPYQYGALNDFMARWGKKKQKNIQYYNVWHTDPDKSNEPEIDRRRASVGLNSYEQQKRNHATWDERIRNKTVNTEIILE